MKNKISIINLSLFILVFFITITFVCNCSNNKTEKNKPNVILISLDTLRKDFVGVFSTAVDSSTPQIDAFKKDSIAYTNAYAPMPFTPPSHMSMLTGVYPDVHNVHGTIKDSETLKEHILPSSILTLTEILKNSGYITKGLYSSDWLMSDFGFGRGFDFYDSVPHSINHATNVTNEATKQIDLIKIRSDPFFLFLHYFDVHSDFNIHHPPYNAPEPFQIIEYKAATKKFCKNKNECATKFLLNANSKGIQLSNEDITLLKKLYMGGVRYTDSEIGRFLNELRKRDLYDNSLIIITSDHGEEFQEHGWLLHDQPYEECSAVPLLIKLPNSKNANMEIDNLVEHIDILPTVLSELKIGIPDKIQGKSILPFDIKNEKANQSVALMQHKLKRFIYSIRNQQYKIIFNQNTKQSELYDLLKDPKELNNIADSEPETTDQLKEQLLQIIKFNKNLKTILADKKSGTEASILNKNERERLKSLGYVN